MTDKLKELLSRCKCGVHLTVNGHRDYHMSAQRALEEDELDGAQIDEEMKKQMIASDTIIHLQFYPETPIGFYQIYHYDLDAALDQALDCLLR